MDKATFDRMHAADRMASDKLKEGIEGFSAALVKLETLLAKRLAELESRAPLRQCKFGTQPIMSSCTIKAASVAAFCWAACSLPHSTRVAICNRQRRDC